MLVQPALIKRPERAGRAQRVEARRPKRLVGVDVADARDEGLVEEQRLEPSLAPAEAAPEVAERERGIEGLRAEPGEHAGAAGLRDELPAARIATVQTDLAELADVAEPDLAPVGELEDQPHVGVDRQPGRDDE